MAEKTLKPVRPTRSSRAKQNPRVQSKSFDQPLREHVLFLLKGGGAHIGFDDAVSSWPVHLAGAKVTKFPHSAWMLLEHMRIAQWDILEFSRNSKYTSRKWPEEYWPTSDAPPDEKAWTGSIAAFRKDLRSIERLVADPTTDLFVKIPWGDGQTILREALLVADHNAYHLGQLVMLRKSLGI